MLKFLVLLNLAAYLRTLKEMEEKRALVSSVQNPGFGGNVDKGLGLRDELRRLCGRAEDYIAAIASDAETQHLLSEEVSQDLRNLARGVAFGTVPIGSLLEQDSFKYVGSTPPPLRADTWALLRAFFVAEDTAESRQKLEALFRWEKPAEAAGHVQCVAPGNDPPLELLS